MSEPSPQPLVVAVMVAANPGDHLETALEALAAQTYDALSVLVVDPSNPDPLAGRVAAVLPEAFVRRLDTDPGYSASANEVGQVVDGAAFYLFLHDDVALEPDAVEYLVAEAVTSNAGVVGPKLTQWDDASRIQDVGLTADRLGFTHPLVEPGELDQAQHDRVRDVVGVPGACMLVRADLFDVLSGFDAAIDLVGEDLNFCWRARTAGARVVVAPAASARHLGDLAGRLTRAHGAGRGYAPVHISRLADRHRLRTVLVTEGRFGLLWLLPMLVLGALVQTLALLVRGRLKESRRPLSALRRSARDARGIAKARKQMRAIRAVSASEARRLHISAVSLAAADLRNRFGSTDRGAAPVDITAELDSRAAGLRQAATVGLALMFGILAIGGRHLVTRGVPAVGQFGTIPGTGELFGEWSSGYLRSGMGAEGVPPVAYALMGLGSAAFLGASALLRTVVLLSLVPIGWFGAWRLPRATGSGRARFAALLIYAGNPLPYNAYADGRLDALVAYATAPAFFGLISRASAIAPWSAAGKVDLRGAALRLGLLGFVTAAFAPTVGLAGLIIAGCAIVGGALVGRGGGVLRVLIVSVGGLAISAVLHLPWLAAQGDGVWSAIVGPRRGDSGLGVLDLVFFNTGPTGSSILGVAVLLAAGVGLIFGRRWRLEWAVRSWALVLVAWSLAWISAADVLAVALPHESVLLAFAALGLSAAGAFGVAAFEADLPRYSFGWRQAVAAVAAAGVVLAMLPVAASSFNGRWNLPKADFSKTMGFLETAESEGGYRVAWVGHPSAIPADAWELEPGVGFSLSRNGLPDARDQLIGAIDERTSLVKEALRRVGAGETDRLGKLLAPFSVRYVVVVRLTAPPFAGGQAVPVPRQLASALAEQVDLARVAIDESVDVYENTRWTPLPAVVDATVEDLSGLPLDAGFAGGVAGGTPTLVQPGAYPGERVESVVPEGEIYLSEAMSDRWKLRLDGRALQPSEALGLGIAFTNPTSGPGSLEYETPPLIYVVLGGQVLAVAVAILLSREFRRLGRWA